MLYVLPCAIRTLKFAIKIKQAGNGISGSILFKVQKYPKVFKVSSILFYSTQKTQKLDRTGALKEWPFRIFNIHSVAKYQKIEGDLLFPFGDIKNSKKSHKAEITEVS